MAYTILQFEKLNSVHSDEENLKNYKRKQQY